MVLGFFFLVYRVFLVIFFLVYRVLPGFARRSAGIVRSAASLSKSEKKIDDFRHDAVTLPASGTPRMLGMPGMLGMLER